MTIPYVVRAVGMIVVGILCVSASGEYRKGPGRKTWGSRRRANILSSLRFTKISHNSALAANVRQYRQTVSHVRDFARTRGCIAAQGSTGNQHDR